LNDKGVEGMKVFRTIIGGFLVLIIIGGIGFLAWNLMGTSGNMIGMNMDNKGDANTPKGGHQNSTNTQNGTNQNDTSNNMASMPNMQNKISLNTMDVKNKDKFSQVILTINEAISQITIDPYSRITVPNQSLPQSVPGQPGNTTINIYPNSTNTVTPITPTGPAPGTVLPAAGVISNANMVYNQGKLEQLHNGIFKLSQGLMLLSELNDDLTLQATYVEQDTYENYVTKYNTLLQNKVKLTKSLSLINEASMMVNVNPYTSGAGYGYDASQMDQLHRGIYRLAQGMLLGTRLSEEFTNQMAQVSNLTANNSMNGMDMNTGFSIGTLNINLILYIIIAVFVLSFIIALFGAVRSAFRPTR
jgi:flagellar basal body-associated protein FliL